MVDRETVYQMKLDKNINISTLLQPPEKKDKKMLKLIDELYSTEVKFKKRCRHDNLTENELIFDLSKISNLNVKNRKKEKAGRGMMIKKESISSFLLNALEE